MCINGLKQNIMQQKCKCKSCGGQIKKVYDVKQLYNGEFVLEVIKSHLEGYDDYCRDCAYNKYIIDVEMKKMNYHFKGA